MLVHRLLRIIAAFLTVAVVAAGCAGDVEDEGTPAETTDTETADAGPAPSEDDAEQTDDADETDEAEQTDDAEETEDVEDDAPGSDDTEPDDEAPTGSGCGAALDPGQSTVSFRFESRDRVYELYVPESYDADTPTPVVLNWHGLGSNGPDQLGFSEYAATADAEGFLVVAPTGVPNPGDTRNAWELADEVDPDRDDMAFAERVLDMVIASACVDEARVFTTGMSNGGYFSSRLVCELSDRIAAASSVAALSHPDDCEPTRPVPYIGFHGVDDDIVPYDGGGFSTLAPGVKIELFELVIPDEFAEFAVQYGCDPEPVEETVSDEVTSFTYQGCPDGVETVFYRIDGGHTWPGSGTSAAISEAAGLGATTTDISATELSWEFFSRHSIDG